MIAIISDIHNNEVNLKKVLNFCQQEKIELIICCGDLASRETLDFLNDNFSGKVYYAFGNMDEGQLRDFTLGEKYKNTFLYKTFGEVKIDGKNIAFTHYPEVARKLAEPRKEAPLPRGTEYDFVFHGHTHKPWVEKIGQCILLNPGNVAGEIYPPTFAILDLDNNKYELKKIHDLK